MIRHGWESRASTLILGIGLRLYQEGKAKHLDEHTAKYGSDADLLYCQGLTDLQIDAIINDAYHQFIKLERHRTLTIDLKYFTSWQSLVALGLIAISLVATVHLYGQGFRFEQLPSDMTVSLEKPPPSVPLTPPSSTPE